jgi:hypothetical protein
MAHRIDAAESDELLTKDMLRAFKRDIIAWNIGTAIVALALVALLTWAVR